MKKRIIAAALALFIVLALGAPALGEGQARLTAVNVYVDGTLVVEYAYTYEDGQSLPAKGRAHWLNEQTMELAGQTVRRTPPDTEWTYTYDEAGRLTCSDSAFSPSGNHSVFRWEYDEAGRLVRDIWQSSAVPGGDGSLTRYSYDGEGWRVRSENEDKYGIVRYVTEYDCDRAGQIAAYRLYSVTDWDEAGEPAALWPTPVNETRYAYDGAGRVAAETFLYDGELVTETAYTYADDPYFVIRYAEERDYMNDRDESNCGFFVNDAAGAVVLGFSMPGAPTLIRDDVGRLVRAEAEGRAMEFFYDGP